MIGTEISDVVHVFVKKEDYNKSNKVTRLGK